MVTTASETAPHMMVGPVLLCVYKDEALNGGYHSSGPRGQVPNEGWFQTPHMWKPDLQQA